MSTNPYQVLGTEIAALRGRSNFANKIQRHLLKPNPDHVSVVGAHMIGKTTFLYHFVDDFPCEDSDYVSAIYWDLAHESPSDDDEFRTKLADVLVGSLKGQALESCPDLTEEFELTDPKSLVEGVIGRIENAGKRILLVMDGMDYALGRGSFSRNIFDWLRSQGATEGLRIITGSRLPLGDLCKSEDSRDSEFWNMFYPQPRVLTAFEDKDWEDVLRPLNDLGIPVEEQGIESLKTWTGGVPVFASGVLSSIVEQQPDGGLCAEVVEEIGRDMVANPPSFLTRLWHSCGEDLQTRLVGMVNSSISASEMGPRIIQKMTDMGFAREADGQVALTCELMRSHAAEESGTVVQLEALFGEGDSYRSSIGAVIEKRFNQIEGGDQELKDSIEQAIRDIGTHPVSAITKVRMICDRARDLVVDAEFPERDGSGNPKIPIEVLSYWKDQGIVEPRWLFDTGVAKGRGVMMVLKMMTGDKIWVDNRGKVLESKCKCITKQTYLLMATLSEIYNPGGHTRDYVFTNEYAASVCLTAVELCATLAIELNNTE